MLSRVPAYLVTNQRGEPYLTESDGERRFGYVFLGPNDAIPVLSQVRAFDPNATLVVVPLATVYGDIARTSADAAAARARVPQPRESTTTDMRLFVLQPLSDEGANRRAVSMLPGADLPPGVVLYYEPELRIGQGTRPYFFRLADLNMVWRQGDGDERNVGRISPSLRVLPLETLLRQVMAAELAVPPLLMPPSETADLQYR